MNTQFSQGRTLEIFTDITEQEFIHNELLKVQKIESLGVLAGAIAHDSNNILTGIMGNRARQKRQGDRSTTPAGRCWSWTTRRCSGCSPHRYWSISGMRSPPCGLLIRLLVHCSDCWAPAASSKAQRSGEPWSRLGGWDGWVPGAGSGRGGRRSRASAGWAATSRLRPLAFAW